jgi:hypothetical protein
MKKLGLMVILVFCVYAISFAQSNNGTFTLTGIPSQYNGKYVFLEGEFRNGELFGFISADLETGDVTLPRISNGRVSIPMWVFNESTISLSRYSGNHTVDLEIMICNSSAVNDSIAEIEFEAVVFTNGSVTKAWSEGEVFD